MENTGKQTGNQSSVISNGSVSTKNMIVQQKHLYTVIGIGQGGCLDELMSEHMCEVKRMVGARGMQKETELGKNWVFLRI